MSASDVDTAAPEPATSVARPVPPTKGYLYLKSIQPGHFWTEHQLRKVLEPEVAGFESCYLEHIPDGERFDGNVYLTFHPTTSGVVSQTTCSVIIGEKKADTRTKCARVCRARPRR